MAWRVTAPPTLTVAGVAVIVSESKLWDDGLLHPAVRINKPHRSPEHTGGMGGMRMRRLVKVGIRSIAAWGTRPFQRRERSFASLRHVATGGENCCLVVS